MKVQIFTNEDWWNEGLFDRFGYLCALIRLDISKRLYEACGKKLHVNFAVLSKTATEIRAMEFPRSIIDQYCLLEPPTVQLIPCSYGGLWPEGDFIYWDCFYRGPDFNQPDPGWQYPGAGEFPTAFTFDSENRPRPSSSLKTISRMPLIFDSKSYSQVSQLTEKGWTGEEIRTLLSGVRNHPEDYQKNIDGEFGQINSAAYVESVLDGNKSKYACDREQAIQTSPEVLLGGLLSQAEPIFKPESVCFDVSELAGLVRNFVEPILALDKDAFSNLNPLNRLRELAIYLLFPHLAPQQVELPVSLPIEGDRYIDLWDTKRLVEIPVQVDKKIRAKVILSAADASNEQTVWDAVKDIHSVQTALGNKAPKKMMYREQEILSLQSNSE